MSSNQKYSVRLTEEQVRDLERIIASKSGKYPNEAKVRAKVLLSLDENCEMPLSPAAAAKRCKVARETVYLIRKQFCEEGLKATVKRKKRETPPVPPKVTGEVEAHIIATACSAAPEGKSGWTLQMIADKIVLTGLVESIDKETVRRTLKKRN
jgi:transposase